ncbi:MAG TPA: MgtC/SapB family protein [Verrucomicrobiae bacterium]|jgi:putative Mg2+ transporter-C (MgtC) family protein|nr:MgtC/SapB family protein [Verrucomicrobiae bacterium]
MPTILTWQAIALRLVLTSVCAGIIGFDRDERGHSAGLRTNLLVGLAACLAMLQANWLINSNGKPEDSYVVMDIMRLPLGILSGIGFIGAGAILKRGELAVGVTTAATIWFVTVMGLCFGGGQIGLGLVGFVLGFLVLTGLKKLEFNISRRQTGRLTISVAPDGPTQTELTEHLNRAGVSLKEPTICIERAPTVNRVYGWKIEWKGKHDDSNLPAALRELSAHSTIQKLELTR